MPDPPPTSATYFGFSNSTTVYTCDCTSNYSSTFRVEPIYYYDRLVHAFQKYFSEAEKALLREMNFKPTREGIDNTERFHSMLIFVAWLTPWFNVRFDRRIPCWRSGRWKSLTA